MKKFIAGLFLILFLPQSVFGAATSISRLRNFVNDKNNSIPITASYVDAELNQQITSLNSKVIAASSAPSSPTAGDSWVDTTNQLVKFYDGAAWITIGTAVLLTNKSGTTRSAGDVVVVNTSNNSAYTTTTSASDETVMGVVLESTADSATGMVQISGVCPAVTVTGSTTRGQFLTTSTTAAKAVPTSTPSTGTFAIALTASSTSVVAQLTGVSHTPTGTVVQEVENSSTTVTDISATVSSITSAFTTSIGTEVITQAITPLATTDKLRIDACVSGTIGTASIGISIGLMQDSTANSLKVGSYQPRDANVPFTTCVTHYMAAGTTSSTTFKLRVGVTNGAGHFYNNGNTSSTALFSGETTTELIIRELKA